MRHSTAPLRDAARIQPALVKRSATRAAKGGREGGRVAPRAHRLRPVEPGAAQDVGSEPGAGRQSPAQRSDSSGQRPAPLHRIAAQHSPLPALALRMRSAAPSALRERPLQRPLQGGRAGGESRLVLTSWPHPKRLHGAAQAGGAVLCCAVLHPQHCAPNEGQSPKSRPAGRRQRWPSSSRPLPSPFLPVPQLCPHAVSRGRCHPVTQWG